MYWKAVKQIGIKTYKCEDWRDNKRYFVFLVRCLLNKSRLEKHLNFLQATDFRQEILAATPEFFDQATRQVFFKDSTVDERILLVQDHICLVEKIFSEELLRKVYITHERVKLWQTELQDKPLWLYLGFRDGQQKEGNLSLELIYDTDSTDNGNGWGEGRHLYQVIFSFAKDNENKIYLRVGALQGLNQGSELIKAGTKQFFGYRPKNLIFWCLRCFAAAVGAEYITAVSNKGYYAMNHWRMDRKLKVDLDAFWQETGGELSDDYRFYRLKIEEYRKEMSELKPSKRAQHRRRFEFLDSIKAEITDNMQEYLKKT